MTYDSMHPQYFASIYARIQLSLQPRCSVKYGRCGKNRYLESASFLILFLEWSVNFDLYNFFADQRQKGTQFVIYKVLLLYCNNTSDSKAFYYQRVHLIESNLLHFCSDYYKIY